MTDTNRGGGHIEPMPSPYEPQRPARAAIPEALAADVAARPEPAETVSPNPLRNPQAHPLPWVGGPITCPRCERERPWTDGRSRAAGDDVDEVWCQVCGHEFPILTGGAFSPPKRDAEDVAPRPWRVGLSWGRTIVESGTGTPDEQGRRPDDRLVGVVETRADAERIVAAVNAAERRRARRAAPGQTAVEGSVAYLLAENERLTAALEEIAQGAFVASGDPKAALRANERKSIASQALGVQP